MPSPSSFNTKRTYPPMTGTQSWNASSLTERLPAPVGEAGTSAVPEPGDNCPISLNPCGHLKTRDGRGGNRRGCGLNHTTRLEPGAAANGRAVGTEGAPPLIPGADPFRIEDRMDTRGRPGTGEFRAYSRDGPKCVLCIYQNYARCGYCRWRRPRAASTWCRGLAGYRCRFQARAKGAVAKGANGRANTPKSSATSAGVFTNLIPSDMQMAQATR